MKYISHLNTIVMITGQDSNPANKPIIAADEHGNVCYFHEAQLLPLTLAECSKRMQTALDAMNRRELSRLMEIVETHFDLDEESDADFDEYDSIASEAVDFLYSYM